jgi:hypothetical protein
VGNCRHCPGKCVLVVRETSPLFHNQPISESFRISPRRSAAAHACHECCVLNWSCVVTAGCVAREALANTSKGVCRPSHCQLSRPTFLIDSSTLHCGEQSRKKACPGPNDACSMPLTKQKPSRAIVIALIPDVVPAWRHDRCALSRHPPSISLATSAASVKRSLSSIERPHQCGASGDLSANLSAKAGLARFIASMAFYWSVIFRTPV